MHEIDVQIVWLYRSVKNAQAPIQVDGYLLIVRSNIFISQKSQSSCASQQTKRGQEQLKPGQKELKDGSGMVYHLYVQKIRCKPIRCKPENECLMPC